MMKKGSLNLSINAIVVIVLALAMMGLGLGFVRNIFEDIGDTTGQVQEQIRNQIIDDLRTGNKPLSFPTNRIKAEVKEKKDIAFGVLNVEDSPIKYRLLILEWANFEQYTDEDGDFIDEGFFCRIARGGTLSAGGFFWDSSPQELGQRRSEVYNVVHRAKSSVGTYLYKLIVAEPLDEASASDIKCEEPATYTEYASKSFFMEIQ